MGGSTMATTATGTPLARPRRPPAAEPGDPRELSDPALISSWSLARVKVALNPSNCSSPAPAALPCFSATDGTAPGRQLSMST